MDYKKNNVEEEGHYRGYNKFQGRLYHLTEVHNEEDIVGKYCFGVEVPGVNHKAKVFTMSVRYYDNEPNNDDKDIKRPAIFATESECNAFMRQLRFPDNVLRMVKIDSDLFHKDIFPTYGAYIVRESKVKLPATDGGVDLSGLAPLV